MKFSIIVPIYNVENYILKCLESINNQSYTNYEVILVNDGSPDNSARIIKKFIKDKNNFKYYNKENGGLSDARNYGLQYCTGDYLLFLDSDDYISNDLLLELNKAIEKNNSDIIKYNIRFIYKNGNNRIMKKDNFYNNHPNKAIAKLLEDELFEPAWLYCYKTEFWLKYDFKYTKGRYHEDFGLTPLILQEAKSISSIDYVGYNYIIREGSIMNSNNTEKDFKKFNDCLAYFKENKTKIINSKNINNETKNLLLSYYANGVLNRAHALTGKNLTKAIKEIKTEKVYKYLLGNTILRKIKKLFVKYLPKIFIRVNRI